MWKQKPESVSGPFIPTTEPWSPTSFSPDADRTARPTDAAPNPDQSMIGQGIVIRGEICGAGALIVDGTVEGTIDLRGHRVIVGPTGNILAPRASGSSPCISAREILMMGTVIGNIAAERVEICAHASLTGDVDTARISIEDGAYFRGGIDIRREEKQVAGPVLVETLEAVHV